MRGEMGVNSDKPHLWKADIAKSVDMYNDWFISFAPLAYRETRAQTTLEVENTLRLTQNLMHIDPSVLRGHPEILPTLRMSTSPPLAVDRLIGLAGVHVNLVKRMEKQKKLPVLLKGGELDDELKKIANTIRRMADPDIFVWLSRNKPPTRKETYRAASVVADRLCGSVANPIIRNAQEKRQLAAIKSWLKKRGYNQLPAGESAKFQEMASGTFGFHMNVPVNLEDGHRVNIPVDVAIMRRNAGQGDLPIFIEAKSAGDYTNVNKRRKEEAVKITQLCRSYGDKVDFILFLCGYFNSGYLGYEAAEGIDWVWEHRIDDLSLFGL
jgi:XamI-like restriction endonuclease